MDKCIGSRIHIIMKNDKEIVGVLLGFDDYVSILITQITAKILRIGTPIIGYSPKTVYVNALKMEKYGYTVQ